MTKLALLSLALASCTHDLAEFDRVDSVKTARDLDILYIYDTSIDHGKYDAAAGQLDVLASQLALVDGQVPNLHVGVVTADLGTKGTTDEVAPPSFRNCAGTGDGAKLTIFDAALSAPYLEDLRGANGTRVRNFAGDEDGDLAAELALLTNPAPGKIGCEVIQPMEAMRRALDPANNPGFLRQKADLLVVFVTNDDDCSLRSGSFLSSAGSNAGRCASQGLICADGNDPSAPGLHVGCRPRTDDAALVTPVSEYSKFLTELKGDKSKVHVSAITGPNDPFFVVGGASPIIATACTGVGGEHKPAPRINALVTAFGGASVNGCTQETVYEQVTQTIVDRSRSCFPQLTADDGDDCVVIEKADGVETELAPCGAGGEAACYTLYTDADACPRGGNVGIQIDRRSSTAPAFSRIEATCFVK